MNVTPTALPEVLLLSTRILRDDRGAFRETWNDARYARAGVREPFVQDNVSISTRDVLRGLHLQHPTGQGKLISVLHGTIYDVAVDVRGGSPTFGQWCGEQLTADGGEQLYIPPGFAHGFLVVGDEALVTYKVTAPYDAAAELTIAWDDPDLGIAWPLAGTPKLSARDAVAPRLRDVPAERLPRWAPPSTADGAA